MKTIKCFVYTIKGHYHGNYSSLQVAYWNENVQVFCYVCSLIPIASRSKMICMRNKLQLNNCFYIQFLMKITFSNWNFILYLHETSQQ